MSSIVVAGDTSGSVTLSAPAVAGTTVLTLPSVSGTLIAKDASNIIAVSGVQFPATQSASADANTLDDYEEGTWTPTLTSFGGTGLSASGTYIKVGRIVTIFVSITGTAVTTTNITSTISLAITNIIGAVGTVTNNANNQYGACQLSNLIGYMPTMASTTLIQVSATYITS